MFKLPVFLIVPPLVLLPVVLSFRRERTVEQYLLLAAVTDARELGEAARALKPQFAQVTMEHL